MAKGRTYELAFKIGGALSSSFGKATGAAAAKLSDLQRKSAQLAARQQALMKFKAVGSAFGNVATQAAGLALGITGAATAAGYGLFRLADATSKVGDEVAKNAQRFGLTTDAYQELAHAAQLSGTSINEVAVGFRGFSRVLDDAKSGTKTAIEAFSKLGLDPSDMKDTDQALELIADRIAALPDGLEKTNAAMELFGKGGTAMIPLLNAGGKGIRGMRKEAHDLGLVLSKEATKKSEEFQDNLLRMKQTFLGLRNTIGSALIPAFSDLFARISKWLLTNQGKVRAFADRIAAWSVTAVPEALKLVAALGRLADRIYSAAKAAADFLGGWDNLLIAFAAFKAAKVAWAVAELGYAMASAIPAAWGLAAALLANPVTWIVAGILAEIAVIVLAIKYWDQWTGWLKQANGWIEVVGAALVVMSGGMLLIPVAILEVIRHGDKLTAMWDTAKTAVLSFAASAWSKIKGVWSVVKMVGLALFEAVTYFQTPLWRGIALVAALAAALTKGAALVLGFWASVTSKITSVLWGLASTVLGPVVDVWLGYWKLLFSGFAAIFDAIKGLLVSGWISLTEMLSSVWSTWGDTVIATVRWVAARAIELLTAPLRLGLQLASMIPGSAAPNLAELVGKMQGGLDAGTAAVEGPTSPLAAGRAALGAPLTGAAGMAGRSNTVNSTMNLGGLTLNVNGGDPGAAASIKQAATQAGDDLLKRIAAAQEQQQRLSYAG